LDGCGLKAGIFESLFCIRAMGMGWSTLGALWQEYEEWHYFNFSPWCWYTSIIMSKAVSKVQLSCIMLIRQPHCLGRALAPLLRISLSHV